MTKSLLPSDFEKKIYDKAIETIRSSSFVTNSFFIKAVVVLGRTGSKSNVFPMIVIPLE